MSKALFNHKSKKNNNSVQSLPKRVIPKGFFKVQDSSVLLPPLPILNFRIRRPINTSSQKIIFTDLLTHKELTRREMLQIISSLHPLREISICPHWASNIHLKNLSNMIEAFRCLTSLQQIHWSFMSYPFKTTDRILDSISKSMKRLRLLKNISLSFHFCHAITDIGLRSLSKWFKACVLLQNIELYFPKCWKITDQGIFHISKSLKRLIGLQKIILNFEWCEMVTDEGLQFLASCLKRRRYLKYIDFGFSYCKEITDRGLESLWEAVDKLTCLQEIRLIFSHCKEVTSRGKQRVTRKLKKHSSLQSFLLT